jgi:hypothetical protein
MARACTTGKFAIRRKSRAMSKIAGELNTYAYARQNPTRYVDPFGLDAWSFFGQGSFHVIDAGASAKFGFGRDGAGKWCFQMTYCGRAGPGASGGLTCGVEYNTEDFEEGDAPSGGFWGNVGFGPFGSGSVTTSGNNTKVSASIGGGAGIAGGGQVCATRTFCVSSTL